MRIRKHEEHTLRLLIQRTVSAQLHTVGALAALVGAAVLLPLAYAKPGMEHFWACFAFVLTGFLVFGASATYHFMADGYQISPKLHLWLDTLDHFSIYLFIAGSYTAFLVNAVAPPWRGILLVLIWTIASAGVFYTKFKGSLPKRLQHRYFSTALFIIMGWTIVVRLGEIFGNLNFHQSSLLLLGGLSYTIGAIGYATKRPNLYPGIFGYHELWHLAVLIGAGLHYFLILTYYR